MAKKASKYGQISPMFIRQTRVRVALHPSESEHFTSWKGILWYQFSWMEVGLWASIRAFQPMIVLVKNLLCKSVANLMYHAWGHIYTTRWHHKHLRDPNKGNAPRNHWLRVLYTTIFPKNGCFIKDGNGWNIESIFTVVSH